MNTVCRNRYENASFKTFLNKRQTYNLFKKLIITSTRYKAGT